MKKLLVTVSLLLIVAAPATLHAQEPPVLEYGQLATGEITNAEFEVPYAFNGAAGDVIVIEMRAVDPLGDLDNPAVILLDSSNQIVGAVDSYGSAIFAAKLLADDAYTILATRRDGRAGESVGEFTLTVLKIDKLEPDVPVSSSLTNEDIRYYYFDMADNATIQYERLAGNFYPAVYLHCIDENELDTIATLEGEQLIGGSLLIAPESPATVEPVIVTVEEALWDYNFDTVAADFMLTFVE